MNCFGAINKTATETNQRVSKFLKSKVFMDEEFTGVAKDEKDEVVGDGRVGGQSCLYAWLHCELCWGWFYVN